MALKENLKMLRKAKGLKQTDLSKIIDKQPLTISRYENGQISPPLQILEKLSELYGVSTRDMMLDVSYEKGKKYNLEEIKEILKEKPKEAKCRVDTSIALKMSMNILKEVIEEIAKDEFKEKEFSEREKGFYKFFRKFFSFYNDFYNNNSDLSEGEVIEILKDLEKYFTFLITKNKK